MSLLEVAKQYRDSGLAVIGSNGKGRYHEWTTFQERLPTDDELNNMFINSGYSQLAIATGVGSGNLEVIDIDVKNDKDGEDIWADLQNKLLDFYGSVIPFPIIQTASGGLHLYYRCDAVEPAQVLAYKMSLAKGRYITPHKCAVIETRGLDGLVQAPPSPGYKILSGDILNGIPTIDAEHREDLLSICRSLNQVFAEARQKPRGTPNVVFKQTPWDHYNSDPRDQWREVLTDAGWTAYKDATKGGEEIEYWRRPGKDTGTSALWNADKRFFYIFTTNAGIDPLIPGKPLDPFAIYSLIRCGGDNRTATIELRAKGFGKPFTNAEEATIGKAVDNDLYNPDNLSILWSFLEDDFEERHGEPARKEDVQPLVDAVISRANRARGEFWEISKTGKISIKKTRFRKFLEARGYRKLAPDIKDPLYKFVKIEFERHLITEMTLEMVKEDIGAWIVDNCPENYDINPEDLSDAFMSMSDTVLKNFLGHIKRIYISDIVFLRDTATTGYFFFLNGVVRVTKEDVEIINYADLPDKALIWPGQIIPRNIEIFDVATEAEANKAMALQFIKRIAGVPKELDDLDLMQLNQHHHDIYEKYAAFLTTIGYLVTNYKNRSQPFAIVLAEDTSTSKEGGGSGKGATVQLCGMLRSVAEYDLSVWKVDKSFALQRVTPSTGILSFDEAPKNFKISSLNALITQGTTIERKNKDEFFLPYEISPKIVLQTNFNISDEAKYEARRQRKILFSSYFHPDHTIEDEFGCEIFKGEWTDVQYKMTFNVLFRCLQLFLGVGIIKYPITAAFKEKRFVEGPYGDIFEFLNRVLEDYTGKWISKDDYYNKFIESGADKLYWKKNRFTRGCVAYAAEFGYVMTKDRCKQRDIRDEEFIIFTKPGQEVPPLVINGLNNASVPF